MSKKLYQVNHWNKYGELYTDVVIAEDKAQAIDKVSNTYGCKIRVEYAGAIEKVEGYTVKLVKD